MLYLKRNNNIERNYIYCNYTYIPYLRYNCDYKLVSYAMLSSGIPWNMPRVTCIFRIHTSLYPTSMGGIVVFLNTKHWIKIFHKLFSADSSFRAFSGNIFYDKNVIFHIWIYTMILELIRIPEIQYPVFSI